MEEKRYTSFAISEELHRNVKVASAVKGITISELMETALMDYLDTLEMHTWVHVTPEHPRG